MLRSLTRFRPESALGFLLRVPLRLIPKTYVATVRTGINEGAKWVVGTSTHGLWLGTYEHEMQEMVSKLVTKGGVVWDVGANAGFYTLALSRLVGASGTVCAFEPFAENVNNLMRHVRINHLNNTKVIQAALGKETELASFEIGDLNSTGHLSNNATSYFVPVLSIDDFLARFPELTPKLIKIDVEGAESAVLAGAKTLLTQHGPEILLALHGDTQMKACQKILTSQGYTLFSLSGSKIKGPLIEHDEIYATREPDAQADKAKRT
jgi:FkbM family methyltransferase